MDSIDLIDAEVTAADEPEAWLDEPDEQIPLERLEADLVAHAAAIAAATCRWLGWLADYDRRRGWAAWGCKSAAHWLSFACGMSLRTARDHVRVARGLEELPVVRAAFGAGELSFSKARALTRLQPPIAEEAMVELARVTTAAQLDRLVAGHRQIDRQTNNDDGGWSQRCYRQCHLPDGMVEVSVVVPVDVATMIDAAVEARVEQTLAITNTDTDPGRSIRDRVAERGGWAAVRADAAIELLGGSAEPGQVEFDIDLTITVPTAGDAGDIDPTATATVVAGARLPTEVARRHGCDATVRLTATNHTASNWQTASIGVGRRSRVVPRWLRHRVERRDIHTCRFPSCTSTRRLHAHHIVHWADFGATDLDNLMLLCSFHHHLVHEGGWTLTGTATNHRITRPDGTPLPTAPTQSRDGWSRPPDLNTITTVADPGGLFARAGAGERYDHNYVVDITWAVNDHHRKRFRGTASAAPTT
ncbi:MAG: HNH endonuclease [Acidimicrobiia bacterium]|nr:HNH endonuclease [Acidimicrobiia bacterium]